MEERIALFNEDIDLDPQISEADIETEMEKYIPCQLTFIVNNKEYILLSDFMRIYNLREDEAILQLSEHASSNIVDYEEEEEDVNVKALTGEEVDNQLQVAIKSAINCDQAMIDENEFIEFQKTLALKPPSEEMNTDSLDEKMLNSVEAQTIDGKRHINFDEFDRVNKRFYCYFYYY